MTRIILRAGDSDTSEAFISSRCSAAFSFRSLMIASKERRNTGTAIRRRIRFACERSVEDDCSAEDCYETEPTNNAADNGRDPAGKWLGLWSSFFSVHERMAEQ